MITQDCSVNLDVIPVSRQPPSSSGDCESFVGTGEWVLFRSNRSAINSLLEAATENHIQALNTSDSASCRVLVSPTPVGIDGLSVTYPSSATEQQKEKVPGFVVPPPRNIREAPSARIIVDPIRRSYRTVKVSTSFPLHLVSKTLSPTMPSLPIASIAANAAESCCSTIATEDNEKVSLPTYPPILGVIHEFSNYHILRRAVPEVRISLCRLEALVQERWDKLSSQPSAALSQRRTLSTLDIPSFRELNLRADGPRLDENFDVVQKTYCCIIVRLRQADDGDDTLEGGEPSSEPNTHTFGLLPLDEAHDIAPLAMAFRAEVEAHTRAIGEDHSSGGENTANFSLFSAHHALCQVALKLRWCPYILASANKENQDAQEHAHLLGKQLCEDLPTAFQILRYFTLCVKSGHSALFRESRSHFLNFDFSDDSLLREYWDLLQNLTTCQRMGIRLAISSVKIAAVGTRRLLNTLGSPIRVSSIANWNLLWSEIRGAGYRGGAEIVDQQHKEATGEEEHEGAGGSSRPTASTRPLGLPHHLQTSTDDDMRFDAKIMSLKAFTRLVTRGGDEGKTGLSAIDHLNLSDMGEQIRKEISPVFEYRVSDAGVGTWASYNFDICTLNDLMKNVLLYRIEKEHVAQSWAFPAAHDEESTDHLDEDPIDPEQCRWIAAICAGFAFPVELPSRVMEHLDSTGQIDPEYILQLTQESVEQRPPLDTFIVALNSSELSLDPVQRLRELYRLKSVWTRLELDLWMRDALLEAEEPSLENLCAQYLKETPGIPDTFENVRLHLERMGSIF